MTHMPIPYKSRYSFTEFWTELTQGSLWRDYCKNNPVESAALIEHATKKINREGDFIPVNLTNTFTGNALLMMILTLPL